MFKELTRIAIKLFTVWFFGWGIMALITKFRLNLLYLLAQLSYISWAFRIHTMMKFCHCLNVITKNSFFFRRTYLIHPVIWTCLGAPSIIGEFQSISSLLYLHFLIYHLSVVRGILYLAGSSGFNWQTTIFYIRNCVAHSFVTGFSLFAHQ